MRRNGKSLGQMAREEIGVVGGVAALVGVFSIMIIILAVLALVVVNALADSPWGTFSVAMTIPIALFMGFYLRILRPGRVIETTVIGVTLLLLAIIGGGYIEGSALSDAFTLSPETLVFCLVVYGFVASLLPVWMLLAPRDYLSTFMKVGVIALLALAVVLTAPVLQAEAITDFALNGRGPVFARLPVPVRVHHDCLRGVVRLPLVDRLGHDPEDDPERGPGSAHRVRRDAHGVLRRHHGADRRVRHRPRPVLRDELARGSARRQRAVRLGGGGEPRLHPSPRSS